MKKVCFVLVLLACLSLCACGQKGPAPYQIIDNDTGKMYSLGDTRDVFDAAFGKGEYNEIYKAMDYLSGVLKVSYSGDKAVEIYVGAETNRFSFYNFDFSMDMKDIKGRYEESGEDWDYKHYTRYYDKKGKDIDSSDAFKNDIEYTVLSLMCKDGEYVCCRIRVGNTLHNFIP